MPEMGPEFARAIEAAVKDTAEVKNTAARAKNGGFTNDTGSADSALEQFDLVLNAFPLLGIRRSSLFLADDRPFLRKFGVELLEVLLAGGDLFLGIDGFDRTFGLAQRAVYALIRVDDHGIRTLVEAVDGTDLHTVHVFAFDAAFGDHERHDLPFSFPVGWKSYSATPAKCAGGARSGVGDANQTVDRLFNSVK